MLSFATTFGMLLLRGLILHISVFSFLMVPPFMVVPFRIGLIVLVGFAVTGFIGVVV